MRGMSQPTSLNSPDRRRMRGGGTQRERRPGVWEIRIPTTPDPARGRTRHRSFMFRGTAEEADGYRAARVADVGSRRCHLANCSRSPSSWKIG